MSGLKVIFCCLLLCMTLPFRVGAAEVRPAGLAGTWYPAGAKVLSARVEAYLKAAKPAPAGRIIALIAPHAGHVYSGEAAGAAWGLAAGMSPRPDTVILLGPSHHYALPKPSIWPEGSYDSPLGPVKVNQALAAKLSRLAGAGFVKKAHLAEHCLEVQIPFLKKALPQATLVPVLTGRPDIEQARRLGHALAQVAGKGRMLLVASSDLSHFHNLEEARRLDAATAGFIRNLDAKGLLRAARTGRVEACGLQALAAVFLAAKELGADCGVILKQYTSAKLTGDKTRVVGYLSAALLRKPPQGPKGLSAGQKKAVLDLARRAVVAAVRGEKPPAPPEGEIYQQPRGAFVTLKSHGRLRGCIGDISGRRPMGRAVVAMAREAALHDPRFPPVSPGELPGLELEVSLLTPLRPCKAQEVVVGRHGILISLAGHQGLLLPQVPVELGWDRERFLQGVCRKAGLPLQAWQRPEARLLCFEAEVFR